MWKGGEERNKEAKTHKETEKEGRREGEISITLDMKMTLPLWQI